MPCCVIERSLCSAITAAFIASRAALSGTTVKEDVVQEAYGRAFTRLREFRGASRIGTWLGRIVLPDVLNEALGRLRRRGEAVDWSSIENQHRVQAQIIPFPLVAAQPDPERTTAQREIRELLERAIDDLPDALVLVARAIEGIEHRIVELPAPRSRGR
jgi:RNA polymerase sigma-70 factor (ECF subfamily)